MLPIPPKTNGHGADRPGRSGAAAADRAALRRPHAGDRRARPGQDDDGQGAGGLARLESMQERAVTVNGTTYRLEAPFIVVATQNPIEQEGTYPLPEAQLDRLF